MSCVDPDFDRVAQELDRLWFELFAIRPWYVALWLYVKGGAP